jgi:hypothetical protein
MEEKKGDVLTQLALISDLLEKVNMQASDTGVFFAVDREEFNRIFDLISKKAKIKLDQVNDKFSVQIGVVEYVFSINKSSA